MPNGFVAVPRMDLTRYNPVNNDGFTINAGSFEVETIENLALGIVPINGIVRETDGDISAIQVNAKVPQGATLHLGLFSQPRGTGAPMTVHAQNQHPGPSEGVYDAVVNGGVKFDAEQEWYLGVFIIQQNNQKVYVREVGLWLGNYQSAPPPAVGPITPAAAPASSLKDVLKGAGIDLDAAGL